MSFNNTQMYKLKFTKSKVSTPDYNKSFNAKIFSQPYF